MKIKIILPIAIFAVSLLIAPQITFASWWNPGTWEIFNRKYEVKIEQAIIATSTSDNRVARGEKATTTEKIEQKSEEIKKQKTTDNFTDTNTQKRDAEKEIEKLKKEAETLKQKQPQVKIIEKNNKKETTEAQKLDEQKRQDELKKEFKKLQAETQRKEEESARALTEGKLTAEKISQQPRLISFKDNLGNIYTEKKDFVRIPSEEFNSGFGASYTPLCLRGISNTNEDCQIEIINWINDRSIEIGKSLNITLDSFDANGDDVFYYITYGSHKDWSYGKMRVLQSWETNKNFNIPITEQLYNETLSENLGWSSVFFDKESRKYYQKNVKLENAGELNINLCFNEKSEQMEHGEQFPYGCMLFKYFILKQGYSNLTASTQSQ